MQEAHAHRTAQLQAERQATQLGIELGQLKGSLFGEAPVAMRVHLYHQQSACDSPCLCKNG